MNSRPTTPTPLKDTEPINHKPGDEYPDTSKPTPVNTVVPDAPRRYKPPSSSMSDYDFITFGTSNDLNDELAKEI